MEATPSSGVRITWIGASMVVVFALWLVLNSGAGPGIAFFYVLPIGMATWWFGRRAGAVTALTCAVLYVIGGLIDPITNVGYAIALRAIAFVLTVVLIGAARERQLVLERSAEELEAIRAALTPSALPELPGVDAGAAFVPSEHGVSGDFYLLTNGPDQSTVAVVGDVVGHGPKAARLATFIRARFAAFAANSSDPIELLTLVNEALIERRGRSEEFVSAVCVRFRASDASISCAVAGHPPPLCLPSLAELKLEGPTSLLGVGKGASFATAELILGRSDGLLVYTDGTTDVRRDDEFLGQEGLRRLLEPLTRLPARVLAREAQQAVLEWADGPIRDDLCLVVLRPRLEPFSH
ncbi:MAG TPA: PP2C family protein-serine/threonine phosphatase [Solirubrobacterales bacterium]|nr:PP2C family protein-serine/threonine phosphatase [Solirubrobacterales bacterium]